MQKKLVCTFYRTSGFETVTLWAQPVEPPILESRVYSCAAIKGVPVWQVAEHQAPVKSCRWLKAPNYSALMTCSWDKTLKEWEKIQSQFEYH